MTYEEAYNHLIRGDYANVVINVAIEAIEKQIPKKPIVTKVQEIQEYCPACKHFVQPPCEKYCSFCGQKLDF